MSNRKGKDSLGLLVLIATGVLISCNPSDTTIPEANLEITQASSVSLSPAPTWVVDPKEPGEDLPPVGRSLFDFLVTEKNGDALEYDVPFPFTALLRKIEARLTTEDSSFSPLKRVLIPLGRSLQRNAAKPYFFKYPRAVAVVDTEPSERRGHPGMFLKDRVYVGYQEKAGVLEVISYNEAAARFEFQIVRDYKPGATPKVVYANRAVCTVCHQNHAPIFSRPPWDETNAHPAIQTRLKAENREFYEFPIDQGVDVPLAIDAATDRANKFSGYQKLWQEGCAAFQSEVDPIVCRAQVFTAVLLYRLSGSLHPHQHLLDGIDQEVFIRQLTQSWQDTWPQGLWIPNPDVPNRNLVALLAQKTPSEQQDSVTHFASLKGKYPLPNAVKVSSVFQPTLLRNPLETWAVHSDPLLYNQFIHGLSTFLAEADIRELDNSLFQMSQKNPALVTRHHTQCQFSSAPRNLNLDRLKFQCTPTVRSNEQPLDTFSMKGRIYLTDQHITDGTIYDLRIGRQGKIQPLRVVNGEVTQNNESWVATLQLAQRASGLHAREIDGNTIVSVKLTIRQNPGTTRMNLNHPSFPGLGVLKVLQDFSIVRQAVRKVANKIVSREIDALTNKPFRRVSVMKSLFEELGLPDRTWCCLDDTHMPQPIVDDRSHPSVLAGGREQDSVPPGIQSFAQYCGTCHQGQDPSPPNFLRGRPQQVRMNLAHCAERIFYRLNMWHFTPYERPETPMPPTNALHKLETSVREWPQHGDLAFLLGYVANLLQQQTGKRPSLEEFHARGYENLHACLPSSI